MADERSARKTIATMREISGPAWEWIAPAATALIGAGKMLAKQAFALVTLFGSGGLAVVAWVKARVVASSDSSAVASGPAAKSNSAMNAKPDGEPTTGKLESAALQYRNSSDESFEIADGKSVAPAEPISEGETLSARGALAFRRQHQRV